MAPEAYTGRTLRMAAEEQRRRWVLINGLQKAAGIDKSLPLGRLLSAISISISY